MANSISIKPSHVALLVKSVDSSARFLKSFGFEVGSPGIWEGEGTREIYVEREKGNSLLLMEPAKPGAYQRAMDKRGPGLHHLAIDVLNMNEFLHSISGSGWLLHPVSIKTIAGSKTAYLARPGFPGLIEVQERESLYNQKLFVNKIGLLMDESIVRLLPSIGLEKIAVLALKPMITLGSHTILLDSILNPDGGV